MEIEVLINKKTEEDIKEFSTKDVKCNISKIKGKDNYIISISASKDNRSNIISCFDIMKTIKQKLKEKEIDCFEIKNEYSLLFQAKLYPKVQLFENNLRKLLQIALCDAEEMLKDAYKSMQEKLEKDKKDIIETYGLLNATDLQDIFEFLFVDRKGLQSIKEKVKENNWHLMNDLKEIKINSLWNNLFKDKFEGFELDKYCEKIYYIRNDIMHFHYLDYYSYIDANKLLNKLNNQLEKQINKNIVLVPADYKNTTLIEENIALNLRNYYAHNFDWISSTAEVMKQLSKTSSELVKSLKTFQIDTTFLNNFYKSISLPEIKSLSEIISSFKAPTLNFKKYDFNEFVHEKEEDKPEKTPHDDEKQ